MVEREQLSLKCSLIIIKKHQSVEARDKKEKEDEEEEAFKNKYKVSLRLTKIE